LGAGLLSSGALSEAAMGRTADAVASMMTDAVFDRAIIIGTEALRVAKNSSEFGEMIRNGCGLELHVISGPQEAELSFIGALYNLPNAEDDTLLIDVGGGSTELVVARKDTITDLISVPIGALRFLESIPKDCEDLFGFVTGRGLDYLLPEVSALNIPKSASVIATGGTITSAAAIAANSRTYEGRNIHGSLLSVGQMTAMAKAFEIATSTRKREMIPFDPERSELILPGLGIFLAFMSIIERQALTVSTGGLRFGTALRPDIIFA
jgi:exopolyphosphatase/guanosine-5'-triphosphate,3'-diphosphate pyrophosphatase